MKSIAPLFCLLSFSIATAQQPAEETEDDPVPQRPVDPLKELLIIDPAVVDSARASYPGAFSIGHLFDQMAGDKGDGRLLMRDWLDTWNSDHVVNSDPVKARPNIDRLVIEPWMEADGCDKNLRAAWLPDFENAPFRLLAIVNRLDLGTLAPVYYGGKDSGAEGRLVYAVIGPDGKPLGHHFTVIFEYHLRGRSGVTKQQMAARWHALGEHAEFGAHYLRDLEELTRRFTDRRRDMDGDQERTEIAQLRTNEMALAETCEMREYHFDQEKMALRLAPLAQTPRMAFSEKGKPLRVALRNYLKQNSERIIAGSLTLPEVIKRDRRADIPLLAGSCTVPDAGFYWETGGVQTRELRRVFSTRTCNGCHARDTDTEFCHIRPRLAGQPSELSDFLSLDYDGYEVEDPGESFESTRSKEMHNRVEDLLKNIHGEKIDKKALAKLVKASFGPGG